MSISRLNLGNLNKSNVGWTFVRSIPAYQDYFPGG